MNSQSKARFLLCTLGICCLQVIGAQSALSNPKATEKTEIQQVVEQMFTGFAGKDIDSVMACWAAESDQFGVFQQVADNLLTLTDNMQVPDITFTRWKKIDTDSVSVRLQFDWKFRNALTKQSTQETMVWDVQFVKEADGWKWWYFSDAINDLANALQTANTKEQRSRLLTEETEAITGELVLRLNNASEAQAKARRFGGALKLNNLAFEVAQALDEKASLGWYYVHQGLIFWYQSQYASALEKYQHALPLFLEVPDKRGEARTRNNIGLIYKSTGRNGEALTEYRISLKIAQETGDKILEAMTRNNIGLVYQAQSQFDEALAEYEASQKIAEAISDREGQARTLHNIGLVYKSMSQYAEALVWYESSLAIERELKNKAGEAATLTHIGEVYRLTNKYQEALDRAETSLLIAQQIRDRPQEAQTLNHIGLIYQAQDRYALAKVQYEMSLLIAQEIEDKTLEAETLNHVGNVYQLMGRYAHALAQYETVLTIENAIDNRAGKARTLNNVGEVYRLTGKYQEAKTQYETSLTISREIGNKIVESQTLNNMGNVYLATGEYGKALAQYKASQQIATAISDKDGEVRSLNNIGEVYRLTGESILALVQYEAALIIEREIDHRKTEAMTRNNMGNIYQAQGQYAVAQEQYQVSLTIAQEIGDLRGEARVLNNLGVIYQFQGKYEEALGVYQTSLRIRREIGDKAGEAVTLFTIGAVHEWMGKSVMALEKYESALKISERIGDLHNTITCHWAIGNFYSMQKQWEAATEAYRKAIELIEKVRFGVQAPSLQIGFFDQHVDPYYGLITSLVALGKKEEAFPIAERAKARSLIELLEKSQKKINQVMMEAEKQQEEQLHQRIIHANLQLRTLQSQSNPDSDELEKVKKGLATARREYDAFRRMLYITHPALQTQRGEFSPLSVSQATEWFSAQKMENLLVLEYVVGDDQTWLFALSGTGNAEVYPIHLTAAELSERVEVLQEAIREKDNKRLGTLPKIEAALRQLDILVAPAALMLAKAEQVCIIPHDVLWNVPFAALKTPDDKYLIETHPIFYAHSLTALKEQATATKKTQQTAPPKMLAVAPFAPPREKPTQTPLYGTFGLLSNSVIEVNAVSKLFGATPYLGEDATEQWVKTQAGEVDILHLATHSVFDPWNGLNSGILLFEGEGEDGFLEAREVLAFDLNANLAVLSACETAQGRVSRGEGVIGLSWAFFVAGCSSTVVSQWKVVDESTAQLMTAFYQNLRAGQNKAIALQQAQLNLFRQPESKFNHPYYWAPFVLVGDWR